MDIFEFQQNHEILIFFIAVIPMILWGYCIWLHQKYDKSTNTLLLLLFLNIYYIPFFLFRVKKLKKEKEEEIQINKIAENIYDVDFIQTTRKSIIENLYLWHSLSEEEMIITEYENSTIEFFNQWIILFHIDKNLLKESFSEFEIKLLNTFDKAISVSFEKIKSDFPELTTYRKTNDWKILSELAENITKTIKN